MIKKILSWETRKHIWNVRKHMLIIIWELFKRALVHDKSKLKYPEKKMFDEFTPALKNLTFGSPQYWEQHGKMLKVSLKHHYENNTHHPEHFSNSVNGMSLLDIVEMFADWKAATLRHSDGNLFSSVNTNKDRFKLSNQLVDVFLNTIFELNWEDKNDRK